MPFIDPEQLIEIYLPPAEIHALQRLTRQRKRMESDVSSRKIRLSAILDGYLPGIRRAFGEAWSSSFRAFLRDRINPFSVVRDGEEALHAYLSKTSPRSNVHTRQVFLACQNVARVCQRSTAAGTLTEEFFVELQDEVARELRLMEASEAESESLARRIAELYQKLHPSDNLSTIPGVGPHTAPIFLANIGDPARFRNQSAFANGGMGAAESPLVAALFGLRSHGLILGVVDLGFTIGAAVGPFLAGYIFDVAGSYQVAFSVSAAIGVVVLLY
jgi:transposase